MYLKYFVHKCIKYYYIYYMYDIYIDILGKLPGQAVSNKWNNIFKLY